MTDCQKDYIWERKNGKVELRFKQEWAIFTRDDIVFELNRVNGSADYEDEYKDFLTSMLLEGLMLFYEVKEWKVGSGNKITVKDKGVEVECDEKILCTALNSAIRANNLFGGDWKSMLRLLYIMDGLEFLYAKSLGSS